ncbi:ribonuclease HII [Candidatus Pacearchaeota archaeon]|nr:ribonuclease HII [Candidatus Pacearchaeota archaeon]
MTKVLGIDEAGRGPVIGPMVIAGVMLDKEDIPLIEKARDSKTLWQKQRVKLDKDIRSIPGVKYEVLVVEPEVIDAAIFSGELNLNWLEAHKQAEIINKLNPDVAIIDCPSINEKAYKEYLQNLVTNKEIELIVEHKADVNYKTSAAASILAKVERERQVEKIKEKYGLIGSGYPADPKTIAFVKENWDKCPEIFRKSWSTYQRYARPVGQKSIEDF